MAIQVRRIITPGTSQPAMVRLVNVPGVKGKSEAIAKADVEAAGLIARILRVEGSPTVVGDVAVQKPAADEIVPRGSRVELYVSVAAPATAANLDERFDAVDTAVGEVKTGVNDLDKKVIGVDARLTGIDTRQTSIETSVADARKAIGDARTDLAAVSGNVVAIKDHLLPPKGSKTTGP